MNLENLGVQEMSIQQVKDVDGGIIPFILAGLVLYGSIAPYYADWSKL